MRFYVSHYLNFKYYPILVKTRLLLIDFRHPFSKVYCFQNQSKFPQPDFSHPY